MCRLSHNRPCRRATTCDSNNLCHSIHAVGIQIEQPAYVVEEDAGTLEVCARIIPVNGSTLRLDPPQGTQAQVQIGLDGFFQSLMNQTISATLFTIESTGPLAATGENFLIGLFV